MDTTLREISSVEYEWELHATADDLDDALTAALKKQRKQVDLPGFRPGKVPLHLVKKRFGEAIGHQVAEQFVQEQFAETVEDDDAIDVLGRPALTELAYAFEGDLKATIRFGVRPAVEVKDLADESLPHLQKEITDEDVEEELERLRKREADLMPVDDATIEETDYVVIDLQRIDPATNTPIIGEKEEDLAFFLDDERLREELRDALVGKTLDDIFRVTLPGEPAPGADPAETPEARRYEVTIHEIKRRELPELDEAFIREVTDGEFEDPDIFRHEIRFRLEQAWEDRADELLSERIIERMLELHPLPVPPAVVGSFLDSYVQQIKQRNDGELPEGFDQTAFREQQAGEAERQGRWMLLRDRIIDEEELEATDDDLDAFFQEQAAGSDQLTAEQIKQYYTQVPRMMEQVRQQVLSQKVMDALKRRFTLDPKTPEAYEALVKDEAEAKAAVSPVAGA